MGIKASKPRCDVDLHTAVKQGNLGRIRTILDSIDSHRSTPVDSEQDLQRLGVTSDNDATYDVNGVDADDETALMTAVCLIESADDVQSEIAKLLLDHPGIIVNKQYKRGHSALHYACSSEAKSCMGALLMLHNQNCDVNMQDIDGNTALVYCLQRVEHEGDIYCSILRMFLQRQDIDANKCNANGQTALHYACMGDTDSSCGLELLLNSDRCDVNIRDGRGETALMYATESVKSRTDVHAKRLQMLLKHPAIDVNVRSNSGLSALYIVCKYGQRPYVAAQLLFSDERCDVNLQDNQGDTALMCCMINCESVMDKFYLAAKIICKKIF